MYFKLVNLTSMLIIPEIEEILNTYPEYPYQAAFTIPYWKQKLIAYVLSRIPNKHMVVETTKNQSKEDISNQFSIEAKLSLENVINQGIIKLLQENQNWKDQQFSVQDLSMDELNKELLSFNTNNNNPMSLLDGRLCITLGQDQLNPNMVSYCLVPLTNINHILNKYECYGKLREQTNEILTQKVSDIEQRYREMSMLNELNDCLQMCETRLEVYQVLNRLLPYLLPDTKGGVFKLNFFNNSVESLARWGLFLESQFSVMAQDFSALHQGYFNQISDHKSSLLSTYIHRQPRESDSLVISLMAVDDNLEFLYVANNHPKELSYFQEQLVQIIAKKTALTLSNLLLRDNIQHQAISDALTGLFNRRYFQETLEREIHREPGTGSSIGIVMIDVDNFKNINDIFGHNFGDLALQGLARCLQKQVQNSDMVCRYGGEEFIIMFYDISLEDTFNRAEQIRQKVMNLKILTQEDSPLRMTVSIGVANFPQHGKTYNSLIESADRALYSAKQQGRNCTVVSQSLCNKDLSSDLC